MKLRLNYMDISKEFKKDIEYFQDENSFQRKLGIKIAKVGVIPFPFVLLLCFKKLGLKYSDLFLIALILKNKRGSEWPYFSLAKVTREMRVCQDTLHKSKDRLIKKYFLRITRRKENPKGKGRNVYDLSGLFYVLEMFIDANKSRLLKSDSWSYGAELDYAFIKDFEKEILSENQRDNSAANRDYKKDNE